MTHTGDDPDAMWKPGYVPPTRDDDLATGPTAPNGDGPGDAAAGRLDADGDDEVLVWRPSHPGDVESVTAPPAHVPDAVGPDDVADDSWAPPDPSPDDLEVRVAGAPAPPADEPGTARPASRRARALAVAGGVAAAVVAATTVSIAVGGGGGSAARPVLPRVPASVDVRWTVSLPGEHADVASVDDLVVIASADRAARVAGLDASTGEERWSVRIGRADSLGDLLVVGDVVLVTSVGRAPMIRAIDSADGDEMWQRRVHADDEIAAFADSVAVIDHDDGALRVVALDPLTGRPTGTLDDPTAKVGPTFVRVEGASVEAFDESLRRVAGPVDVDDAPFAVAVVGDVIVSAGSGRLRATELDGRERWVMEVGPDGVRSLLPSGAEPTEVLLLSPGSITAVDTRGAEPVVRWSLTGGPFAADPSVPGIRYLPMRAGAASPLLRIVDLRTGEVVSTIDAGASTGSPLVGADGLVLGRQVDADTWRLEGRGFRGGVSWTTELDGAPQLVDGGVVGVNLTDGAIVVTYAGRG